MVVAILLSATAAALSASMAVAWWVQKRTGETGWIDVFWTFSLGLVAAAAALAPFDSVPWPQPRQTLVAVLVLLWSLRLGSHIVLRTRSAGDDPRYRHLIEQWGNNAGRILFLQLQIQAAVSLLLTLSVFLAAHNPEPGLRLQDVFGALVWLTGIVGEGVADSQLRQFRKNSAHGGGVCDVGLWRLSRHPNYFFEWLCWCAYPLIAIDLAGRYPYGWAALLAPACMYWLLTSVSGIPPLEDHMARTRGPAWETYRKRTSAFFPFWPGKQA